MFKVVWVNYKGDRCEKRGFKNPDEARKWIASRRWVSTSSQQFSMSK